MDRPKSLTILIWVNHLTLARGTTTSIVFSLKKFKLCRTLIGPSRTSLLNALFYFLYLSQQIIFGHTDYTFLGKLCNHTRYDSMWLKLTDTTDWQEGGIISVCLLCCIFHHQIFMYEPFPCIKMTFFSWQSSRTSWF